MTSPATGVSLAAYLNWLLRSIDPSLTYGVKNGGVTITTRNTDEESPTTRFYPVWDLVSVEADRGNWKGDYDPLVDVLYSTVEPSSWDEVGGAGTAAEYKADGMIIVSQSHRVHREIEKLLSALRRLPAIDAQRDTI